MFKAILLSLALVSGLRADVKNTTPIEDLNGGLGGSSYGSLTYALNNALTGTSSSAIDLSGTAGLWLSLTSTTGVTPSASVANVLVYFSNANVTYTTGATQMYILQSPGSYSIYPKARYVSFYNGGTAPTTKVSAFYYTVAPAPIGVTGTFTNGTVTAYIASGQGLSITSSPVFNPLSFSTYVWQTYTATTLNLTTVAGVSVRCSICLSPSFGGAGIRTAWSTSATAPSDIYSVGLPIATSATGQCFGPFAPGTIFHTIGSGSSAVTGRIQVDGVY